MPVLCDGPQSALFKPVSFSGNTGLASLADFPASDEMAAAAIH